MPWNSPQRLWRWKSAVLAATVAAAPMALAGERTQEIFVARGAHGEVSFSDESRAGAERIEVTVREPSAEALLAAERRVEQTLRVARALEESRLARERERAERARPAPGRAPAVATVPAPMDPWFAYLIGRPAYPHFSPRHRHPSHKPVEPTPLPEPILQSPMMPRGAAWRADDGSSWLRPAAEG